MAMIPKCTACGVFLRHQTPFDLCDTCQKAELLYGDLGKHECDAADFDDKRDFCTQCTEEEYPDSPRLKLFKVTIPSQTIPTPDESVNLLGADIELPTVGTMKSYGFIQGREIFVLAESYERLRKQCLQELGCLDNPSNVKLRVEELAGPFRHGFVISHNQVDGL